MAVQELLDEQKRLVTQRANQAAQAEAARAVLNPAPKQNPSDFIGTVRTSAPDS